MFALKAKFVRDTKYRIVVKTGKNVELLGKLGWIVFNDPGVLLADMTAGKKMLNMKYEKREQIMAHLRKLTPAVGV
jgi:hypothetical protein